MTTKKNILREIFSGANGKLSAKRVIGGIAMAVALGCTIYLTVVDGSNGVVENLLMTVLIMGASLLGLPAVTGIWNKSKMSVGSPIDDEPSQEEQTPDPSPIPDCSNCEYKKKSEMRPPRKLIEKGTL